VTVKQDPGLEQELVRQNSLGYGGLIAIGVVLVQPFLMADPPQFRLGERLTVSLQPTR
jgi:hypothetical protein